MMGNDDDNYEDDDEYERDPEYSHDDGEGENELGCCFPEECCMPGPHYRYECHTAEMLMEQHEVDIDEARDRIIESLVSALLFCVAMILLGAAVFLVFLKLIPWWRSL